MVNGDLLAHKKYETAKNECTKWEVQLRSTDKILC